MQQIKLLQCEKRHMEYKLQDLTEQIKCQNVTIKDLKADNENKHKEIKFLTNQLTQPGFIVSEHTLHPLDFTYSVNASNDYIPAVYDDRDNVITFLQARTEMQSEHIEELNETILRHTKSAATDIEDLRKELKYHNQCKIRELRLYEELQNYKQLERGYKETLRKRGQMLDQLEKENNRIRYMKNELQQDKKKLTMENSNLLKHYNSKMKTLNHEMIKLQTELSRLQTKLEKQNAKLKNNLPPKKLPSEIGPKSNEVHPCKVEGIDSLSAKYRKQSERVFPSDWSTEEKEEKDTQLEGTNNRQVKLLNELDAMERRKTAEMEVLIKKYKHQLQNNAAEMGNLKAELKNIKKQLQAKDQTEMSHEHNMKTMQLEIREKDSQLKDMERNLTKANKQIAKYEEQYNSKFSYNTNVSEYAKQEIKDKNAIIQRLENTLENIQSENRRLKRKLEEAESIEYVSAKNRPMNIASEYELLYSNEWHDAKGILDQLCQLMDEEDKIKLLRFIFEVSEHKCNSHLNMVMNQFESMLEQPMENLQQQSQSTTSSSVTDEVKVFVGDCLRKSADTANILSVVQDVLSEAGTKYHHEASTVFAHNNFRSFVEACVRLSWKMVLQRPPMCFVQDGIGQKWQGDGKQELFWRSSDPSDPLSRVKYYVHPALHHGETMMVKGRVFLSRV